MEVVVETRGKEGGGVIARGADLFGKTRGRLRIGGDGEDGQDRKKEGGLSGHDKVFDEGKSIVYLPTISELHMENLSGYCKVVVAMDKDNVHVHYHDKEYGFPIEDDNELFARLILEVNQAGLSWTTILNKKDNFFKAFDNFDIDKVSRYTAKQKERLLKDAGIIR